MTTYRADPAAAHILQILLLLCAGVLCLAAWIFLRRFPAALICVCAAVLFAAVLSGGVLLPLALRRIRCIVTNGQITVKSGIFLRREQSLSIRTIQFVQVIHCPFSGKGGLHFIILHLCGGRMLLPFLGQEDCTQITEFLRNKGVYHAP